MSGCVIRCELFFLFFFFSLFFPFFFYSRWTSSLRSCLWPQRIFPSLPGSRLAIFLSRCKFSTLTTRQPMVEFGLKKNVGAEKKIGGRIFFGVVEKVIWPPNTITRRRRKKKKTRFVRLGAEKYDFRAPKGQRPRKKGKSKLW